MDPKEIVNVKIRSMHGRFATTGVHIVPTSPKLLKAGLVTRKLKPHEVVGAPYELVQRFIESGHLETTTEDATRPLLFANGLEAKYAAPDVHVSGAHEEMLRDYYRDVVRRRMRGENIEETTEKQEEERIEDVLAAHEASLQKAHKESRRAPDVNEVRMSLPSDPEAAKAQESAATSKLVEALADPSRDTVGDATPDELAIAREEDDSKPRRGRGRT